MFYIGGEWLSHNLADVSLCRCGGSTRLLMAVVAVEFVSEDKAFFYTVH